MQSRMDQQGQILHIMLIRMGEQDVEIAGVLGDQERPVIDLIELSRVDPSGAEVVEVRGPQPDCDRHVDINHRWAVVEPDPMDHTVEVKQRLRLVDRLVNGVAVVQRKR